MIHPRCSIIIRCYNEEQHIGRLLDGIQQQTIAPVEIIVVDSGSTDRTVEIAQQYSVTLVSIRPEEFSFGRSLNLGCQAASAELIVIASAHVYPVYRDWLEQLLKPFADPQMALVYGKQRGNDVTKYSEHQIFATWFPDDSNLNQTHPFCNNANAAIRRKLWQQLPYDESLTGLEDLDWAKRVMQLGHRIAYSAEAEIIHVHDETPRRIYNRYRREAIALKRIFPQEHFNGWDFVRLFVTNTFNDYYHAFHDRVLFKNFLSIPVFRFMQFLGTCRGFMQRVPVTSQLKQTFYYPRGLKRHALSQTSNSRRAIDYTQREEVVLEQIRH
ncbi:glycosyltransferase family 2 protein [Thermocoleostomius sinensis]|uniref:Glucosyl-3-phosphoglycerate synthase n=1 Tax=Thermocoleostomius sinensis A174 TaxID=2016057 RepID=A0A9E8Z9Z1_9CYAN|nr:glycosyltransferase [Thermocoleostomius sinensis]WAL58972.1 glycosyltransferase [Thermocoleostomius sinensis A174]